MTEPAGLNKLTVQNLIKTSKERFSSLPCLSLVESEPLTYSDVYQKSIYIAHMLQKMGMGKDSHVAILSENTPNWGISYFAVSLAGCIAVPVLPDFAPSEVKNILIHSESAVCFCI